MHFFLKNHSPGFSQERPRLTLLKKYYLVETLVGLRRPRPALLIEGPTIDRKNDYFVETLFFLGRPIPAPFIDGPTIARRKDYLVETLLSLGLLGGPDQPY